MDDIFCFRKPTTYGKYQKGENYRKLHDLFDLNKNKFLNTASGIVLFLLFKCFSSLSSLHYPFIETDQQAPHLLLTLTAKKRILCLQKKSKKILSYLFPLHFPLKY